MKEGKSFIISQHQVAEAYKRVKANRGAAGIDEVGLCELINSQVGYEKIQAFERTETESQ